ncbi:hypothetical protein G6F66_010903 [Rhizopus arrhizus]|nr:hypothetical protein G6F66_010903 [Rhizopus arrhizus]
MDVDYLAKANNNSSSRKPQQRQLRAYDKQGNPIWDYCYEKHRTVDHNKKFNNTTKTTAVFKKWNRYQSLRNS